jgi:hypothetical protein
MTEVRDMTVFVVATARAVAWKTTVPRFLGCARLRSAGSGHASDHDLWHTEVFYTNLNHSEARSEDTVDISCWLKCS